MATGGTQECYFYNRPGGCWYGNSCRFKHPDRCKFYSKTSTCCYGDKKPHENEQTIVVTIPTVLVKEEKEEEEILEDMQTTVLKEKSLVVPKNYQMSGKTGERFQLLTEVRVKVTDLVAFGDLMDASQTAIRPVKSQGGTISYLRDNVRPFVPGCYLASVEYLACAEGLEPEPLILFYHESVLPSALCDMLQRTTDLGASRYHREENNSINRYDWCEYRNWGPCDDDDDLDGDGDQLPGDKDVIYFMPTEYATELRPLASRTCISGSILHGLGEPGAVKGFAANVSHELVDKGDWNYGAAIQDKTSGRYFALIVYFSLDDRPQVADPMSLKDHHLTFDMAAFQTGGCADHLETGSVRDDKDKSPLTCGICGQTFTDSSQVKPAKVALEEHYMNKLGKNDPSHSAIFRQHEEAFRKVAQCAECERYFTSVQALLQHVWAKSQPSSSSRDEHLAFFSTIVHLFTRRDLNGCLQKERDFARELADYLCPSSLNNSSEDGSGCEDSMAKYLGQRLGDLRLGGRGCYGDSDDDSDDGYGCFGFGSEEVQWLLSQGIKPWDDEAFSALAYM